MKATVTDISSVQKRIKVEVDRENVVAEYERVLQRFRKKANLKGFRPGKAPLSLIKQVYSEQAGGEVGERLIQQYLQAALEAEKIRPISTPVVDRVDTIQPDTQFSFDAVVDIMPEIELPSLEGVAIEVRELEFHDGAVDKELEGLRRRQAKGKALPEDATAQTSHLAIVSHHATFLDGTEVADLKADGVTVGLGQGEVLPALETMLIGMKVGEEKTDTIALPDDYQDADLASKEIHFTVKLTSLSEMVLPELDDEFAKDLGLESLEALKTAIRDDLHRQINQMNRNEKEGAALTKVLELKPFEVPPAMVDQVIDSMISEIVPRQDKKRWEEIITNADIRKRFLPEAKRRAQNTLVLLKVIEKDGLKIEDSDVEQELQAVSGYKLAKSADQLKIRRQMLPRLKENKLFEKAMQTLLSQMQVSTKVSPV
jgi:trigger factor